MRGAPRHGLAISKGRVPLTQQTKDRLPFSPSPQGARAHSGAACERDRGFASWGRRRPQANSFIASGENGCSSRVRPSRTFTTHSGSCSSARPTATRSKSPRSSRASSSSEVAGFETSPGCAASRTRADRPTEPTVMVGHAGELLGPAGEVEVGAFELRLPEAPLRAVEDVDAGVDQRRPARPPAPSASAPASPRSPAASTARCADDHGSPARPPRARRDDLGGEAGALGDRWSPPKASVRWLVAVPEELVDQVAVRAVQLDAVEAERLGVAGGVGEGARWRRRRRRRSSARRPACRARRGPRGRRTGRRGPGPVPGLRTMP